MIFTYVTENLNPGQVNTGVQALGGGYVIYWWVMLQTTLTEPHILVLDSGGKTVLEARLDLEKYDWHISTHSSVYAWQEYECISHTLQSVIQEIDTRIAEWTVIQK